MYVNTASIGLPPRRVAKAVDDALEVWRTGRAEAADYDAIVDRARRRFAGLVGVSPDRVAIGNQVSTFSGLVAAALPDGAHVLAAEEDFSSVLFPFLAHADRGVRVETVPLDRARRGHPPRRASRRGERGAVRGRAARPRWARGSWPRRRRRTAVSRTSTPRRRLAGCPFDAGRFDFVSCAAYKWLLSPRGTAFGVVRPERSGHGAAALRRLVFRRRSVDLDLRIASATGEGRAPARHLARVAVLGRYCARARAAGRGGNHCDPSTRCRARECAAPAARSAERRFGRRHRGHRRWSRPAPRRRHQGVDPRRRGASVVPSPQHGIRRDVVARALGG